MALILNIHTALDTASVCLAKDGELIFISKNEKQNDHATWMHTAIKDGYERSGIEIKVTDAVAVTHGPGSYTGLRIGLAAAKGICYALNKPLITLNTLKVMANAAANVHKDSFGENEDLLCPMIDARRMEVFTAMYTSNLEEVRPPVALVLEELSFKKELESGRVCFFGNGSAKFFDLCKHSNAVFRTIETSAADMIRLSEKKFSERDFADLAYAEPLYLKEFYSPVK